MIIAVLISDGLKESTYAQLSKKKKQKGKEPAEDLSPSSDSEPIEIILNFKRYIFDPQKKMVQV